MPDHSQDYFLCRLEGKKHVIWDWNGTLLNDIDHTVQITNQFLQEQSLPLLDKDRYHKVFEFPIKSYYDKLGFDYTKESFASLCDRFVELFMLDFQNLPLVEGIESVLQELHQRGVHQSVLSAADQKSLDSMVTHFKLGPLFSYVFGIDNNFAASKIERGRQLIKQINRPASELILIGDTLHDLEVANDLGIEALLVTHGHQCPTRLRAVHGAVVSLI